MADANDPYKYSWLGPVVMGLSGVGSAISQAQAMRAQGAYQKSISEINARRGRMRAEDAVVRGHSDATAVRRQANKVKSEQRAAAAAQGQDPNSGDFADLQLETDLAANQDMRTIETNAWREAFGHESEAANATAAGRFADMTAQQEARTTVLTGGMRALSYGLEAVGRAEEYKTKKGEK